MDLSGLSVNGQNGLAERAIQTVVNSAREMMLHKALHWPEYFDRRMWPFTLSHAAYLWNHLPSVSHGLTLLEIYTGTKQDIKVLRNENTWGWPAYVLDAKLQDGKKLPKWIPRERRGQYLGKSPLHAN